jgi:hypothetical protein
MRNSQSVAGAWRRRWSPRLHGALVAAAVWLVAADVFASGGPPAKKLVNVADTRALEPGVTKFVGDLYNTSYWLYALLVVVTMATMGLVLGLVCDRLMGLLGINLGKMDHHE